MTSNPGSSLVALRGRIDAGTVYEPRPGVAALAERLFAGASRTNGGAALSFGLDDDPADAEASRFIAFHASGLPDDLESLARAVAHGFALPSRPSTTLGEPPSSARARPRPRPQP